MIVYDPVVAKASLRARAEYLAPLLRAMSDENRLAIVMALSESPASVGELGSSLGLGQALVSHHLRALREACLVSVEARGRSNVYSLCCAPVVEVITQLTDLTRSVDPVGDGSCCTEPRPEPQTKSES